MSEERLQQIMAYRKEMQQLEEAKKTEGTFIDGSKIIEKALASRKAREPLHELVAASKPSRPRSRVRF